jgi:hypothetical protein
MSDGLEREGKKGCCTPALERDSGGVVAVGQAVRARCPEGWLDMVALEGGAFLMGTDYAEAFPLDGEGPVREGFGWRRF